MTIKLAKETEIIQSVVDRELARSPFFIKLAACSLSLPVLGKVFNQYYWWRNHFHQWFGVCIARTPPFGTQLPVSYVLKELTEHIQEEIEGDHHGLCVSFLKTIGVTSPEKNVVNLITEEYCNSFIKRYFDVKTNPALPLAALAGRELVTPKRNRIIIDALRSGYNIKGELTFLDIHEDLEVEHFEGLWNVLLNTYQADAGMIRKSAELEIIRHIKFWDDTYQYVVSKN